MTLHEKIDEDAVPDIDEYDKYSISSDPELLPYVVELPESQASPDATLLDDPLLKDAPASPRSTYSDEFSKYDLSDYSAEELAAFEAILSAPPDAAGPTLPQAETYSETSLFAGNSSSGPAVEIEIECAADESVARQDSSEGVTTSVETSSEAHHSQHSARNPTRRQANRSASPPRFTSTSHYSRFRSNNNVLSVSDLAAPSW